MQQPDDFAALVVMTVKTALAPYIERIATLEQCNRELQAKLLDVTALRERVVAVETKAALPIPVPAVLETKAVDLSPLTERVAALETKLLPLADVRDRVIAMETKAAASVPTAEPVALGPTVAEMELAIRRHVDPAFKELSNVRERVAVIETRAAVPGPAGKDGAPGKDGADGLGFDELMAVQSDERSITVKAVRGDREKVIGTARFPVLIHRGVYIEGKSYEHGDVVTWGGSQWHCNEETNTKPGEGSKAWTLVVKRGRDGRDGQDAPGALPVVSVGARS